jgi:pimeloyl-ACP methyl ester carboxylesterase
MNAYRSAALLAVFLCSAAVPGCVADFQPGDEHFFVEHEGASMPVWVTGNWRSNRILLHVHGGPGTTNGIYFQKESYARLADEFGIAYWEQRASGTSLGHHRGILTVEQYVEDLDRVVTVLEHRYPDAEFVLMGHSWGGFLTASYLLDPVRQARFRGWIVQDGAIDVSCARLNLARDFVLERGVPGAAEFYASRWICDPVTNENNQIEIHLQHSLYVRAAGGYDVRPERVLSGDETNELLFASQFDLIGVTQNAPLPIRDYYGRNLIPELSAVTIPSLVLWGTHDIITHHSQAMEVFDGLGASRRRIVLFEDSGHNPWAEQPEAFHEAVASFLREEVWP